MSETKCVPLHREHVLVAVSQNQKALGFRVLRLSTDYLPVVKELEYRALATHDKLAGRPWRLNARIAPADHPQSGMIIEAHAVGPPMRSRRPLASLLIPLENFAWVASGIAARLGLTESCQYHVMVLDERHPLAQQRTGNNDPDPDFEVTSGTDPSLHLPMQPVATELPVSTQVMHSCPKTWLRCLFGRQAYESFRSAARQEKERERSWAGLGKVHLLKDCCYTTIDELVSLPGESGPSWIRTRGRDFADLHHRFGDRLSAYLHLHPRLVEGRPIRPAPSDNDAVVAWNYSAVTAIPCVFPIALFGTDSGSEAASIGVYGYDRGALSAIPWEVLTE
jgi:hypothetical protein